jgi:hypothetical protein
MSEVAVVDEAVYTNREIGGERTHGNMVALNDVQTL